MLDFCKIAFIIIVKLLIVYLLAYWLFNRLGARLQTPNLNQNLGIFHFSNKA